jgi:hypothetical protein
MMLPPTSLPSLARLLADPPEHVLPGHDAVPPRTSPRRSRLRGLLPRGPRAWGG